MTINKHYSLSPQISYKGKLKKITVRTLLVFLIIIPIAAFAHFIIFPQETRCILIDYSSFKKDGRLYFSPNTSPDKIDTLKSIIQRASIRVADFWGGKICNPKFIYCDSEEEIKKYISYYTNPATTYIKLGSYIVVSEEGVDLDIIAHEMCHAELGERIGFLRWTFKIPVWFNEGLAMQTDYRDYYSEDTLKVKSDSYKHLPHIINLKTASQFLAGTPEQVMLNYMTAKHVVKNWYTKEKLNTLINDLNSGKSFKEAFGR